MSKTLYDKIWEDHLVHEQSDGTSLIYVDRHLVHEVTSPQAFEGLRLQKRQVRRIQTQQLMHPRSQYQLVTLIKFLVGRQKNTEANKNLLKQGTVHVTPAGCRLV